MSTVQGADVAQVGIDLALLDVSIVCERIGSMKSNSANVQVVKLTDGREVCLSYGVIVAAFIPKGYPIKGDAWCEGYVRTDARYSVTTSRHMNAFAGKDSPIIPDADLKALCLPVAERRTA